MTNTNLFWLLKKFQTGDSLPPLVLEDNQVIEAVNFIKWTDFPDISELRKDYSPGVFFFENETGSIKIDQTRKIIEQASIRSNDAQDIFIIEGIDTLTLQAANSLLKLFEEVPAGILILLTSSSWRDSMIETLASRVIFLSSNSIHSTLDAEVRAKIDRYFDEGNHRDFLGFLATEKLEKETYLSILIALKDRILSGHITNHETIARIESGIITLSSTNANPRWVVDEVVLGL